MSEITYPTTFVKGTQTRIVRNVREAVKARFDGFKTVEAAIGSDHPVRVEVQAAAKAAGVPANKSTDEIVEALVATETASATPDHREKAQDAGEGKPQPTSPDQDPAPAEPTELAETPAPAKPSDIKRKS